MQEYLCSCRKDHRPLVRCQSGMENDDRPKFAVCALSQLLEPSRINDIWRLKIEAKMDEDDDFFDMRGRFRVPEKRKKNLDDDDDSNSDSDSDSSMFRLFTTADRRF